MNGNEVLLLGLGIQSPLQLVDQRLDVNKQPHELHLTVRSDRGQKYACPVCGAQCAAHDFQEKTWRHLNFFQHHCYIHASVPRVKCPEHGGEADRHPVGAQRQCLHAAVRTGGTDAVARDAGQRGDTDDRDHGQSPVAHRRVLGGQGTGGV